MSNLTKEEFKHLAPEQLQDYIDIATEALIEILEERGMTAEEFRARRKQIVAEEQDAIAAEKQELDGDDA